MTTPTLAPLAVPRILKAVRALLLADDLLTTRLATAPPNMGGGPAIYTEGYVPADARTDYLTIGPFTEISDSTMGTGAHWGSNVTMQTRLTTQSKDIGYSLDTVDRLTALLHGVPLTVADYHSGQSMLDMMVGVYEELLAGAQYRHYPLIWRIRVHQSP